MLGICTSMHAHLLVRLAVETDREHGLALHKGAFRDTLNLHYGWHTSGLPSILCLFKKLLFSYIITVDHAINSSTWVYPISAYCSCS